MTKFTKTIKINAPVEKVFAYLATPTNLPEIWPSMIEVKDVKPLPNGGSHFHWKYKMAGMPFEGDTDTMVFEANKHVVTETKTGIPSKWDYVYHRANGGTELTLTGDSPSPFHCSVNWRSR